ncbi:hypothetical protein NLI96_g6317 [Meripilus lineatus]|uniref:Uncharacterized protein n=1 Tax=Meripilus lineatus TaxID=2056292 RepID=A0AAD5V2X6_9APHY|nr:hypothetical protein NLI96_g6317 [Physisporinus lineatus]
MVCTTNKEFPGVMIAEVFESMEFTLLAELASGKHEFGDLARLVLNLRYNRMLERFYPRAGELRDKLDSTSSVISGSFVLEFALYHQTWRCNDLDIYTHKDKGDEWEAFLKEVGYVRKRKEENEEEGGGEPYFIATVKEIRTFVRTKPRGRISTVDVICADTRNVLRPIGSFWNSLVQNFATGHTFTFAYPRNTFSYRGHVTGMWRQDDRVPELVWKYLARGFSTATPISSPVFPDDFPAIRRTLTDCFSWSLDISNGKSGDDFEEQDSVLADEIVWFDGGVLLD